MKAQPKLYDAVLFNKFGQRLQNLVVNVSYPLAKWHCKTAKVGWGEYALPMINGTLSTRVVKAHAIKRARSKEQLKLNL